MANSPDSVVRLVTDATEDCGPKGPPRFHASDYQFRSRWYIRARAGYPLLVCVDASAIALGISVARAWTPAAAVFGAFALILCATWARVGDRITVSGFDHAGRALASVAIAHLGVEILFGSGVALADTVTVVCSLFCLRFAIIWCLRVLRAHHAIGERVLVLGDDEEEIAEAL